MNKRTLVICGCVFVSALVFDIVTKAQSARVTPIIAKLRQINYWVEQDGTRTLARESVGVYARSANGSEHTTYFPNPDPTSQVRHSRLFDKTRGIVYQVNHATHVATVKTRLRVPFDRVYQPVSPDRTLGSDATAAIPCSVVAVGRKRENRECISYEYDVLVRREVLLSGSLTGDKRDLLTVMEIFDVEIGKEPPASLFEVPQSYRIVETSSPHN